MRKKREREKEGKKWKTLTCMGMNGSEKKIESQEAMSEQTSRK